MLCVLPTIQFDDQAPFKTDKVGDIGSDWILPFELASAESVGSHGEPEFVFGIRRFALHAARIGQQALVGGAPTSGFFGNH